MSDLIDECVWLMWGSIFLLRALTTMKLNSYIAILASPKYKNLYHSGVKGKNFNLILRSHYFFFLIFLFFLHFILLSSCLSPHCLSIFSFFLHRPITDLHEPSCHKPIAADPCLTTDLIHLGHSSLFSPFQLCVSSCAYVSGWIFVLGMGFGLAVLIFLLYFFVLLHWFWWA